MFEYWTNGHICWTDVPHASHFIASISLVYQIAVEGRVTETRLKENNANTREES